jgi:hypothetical protein
LLCRDACSDHPHVAAFGNPAAKLRQQLAKSARAARSVTLRDYEALVVWWDLAAHRAGDICPALLDFLHG